VNNACRLTRLAVAALMLLTAGVQAQEAIIEVQDQGWTVDVAVFMLGAGMSGETGVGGNLADVDVSFSDVLENLELGGMGSLRVARNRWAFTTEVIYMDLGASKGQVSADVDQWMVEPSLAFRVSDRLETIVGARYMNLSTEIRGPFGRNASGTVDWWDPIIGGKLTLPIREDLSFNLRADVGGFGVGSEFAWQAFPFVSWQLSERSSLEGGYRWLDVDYDEGSGPSEFTYDMLTQGLQLGATFRF
jgi:outer membrane receptor protein involved in Fe transport